MSSKFYLASGAIIAGLAVMAGAFGAHALKGQIPDPVLVTFELAVRYQMYHALALCFAGWAMDRWTGKGAGRAAFCFLIGIVIFSGSLYLLVITGYRWLGAVTPFGGLAFILGWMLLAGHLYNQEE